jgi:hypothetical protein
MLIGSPLFLNLRRSAESVGVRGGRLVPLRYGSVTAEMALSMRSVGLVDREDLAVARVVGRGSTIDALLLDHAACVPVPGEAVSIGGAHFGRTAAGELVITSPAGAGCRPTEEMREDIRILPGAWQLSPLLAIGLLGPATIGLLTDLDAIGPLAWTGETGRIAITWLGGTRVTWMLLSDDRAFALVDPAAAVSIWRQLGVAGRRFGLGYVGAEATERLELVRCRVGDPSIA